MNTIYNQFVIRQGKKPVDWRTCLLCDGQSSDIWLSYDQARTYAAAFGDAYSVGFIVTEQDPFFFIDLDHCRDGETLTPLAQSLIEQFAGCYSEVSQSGTGLHIVGASDAPYPPHKCRAEGIEFYTADRMISLTGHKASGDCNHRPGAVLGALIRDRLLRNPTGAIDAQWTDRPVEGYGCTLSDDQLVEKALHSHSNFALLWSGNIAGYGHDASSADLALCNHLQYWTGGDCARVERLFGLSGLVRDKWNDREDYRRETILSALQGTEQHYTGRNDSIEWVHLSGTGRPLQTVDNIQALLAHMGGTCRYNLMTKKTELLIPGFHKESTRGILISAMQALLIPSAGTDRLIEAISRADEYCPARDWITSAVWDGEDRIEPLAATLNPKRAVLAPMILKRWLIAGAQCLLSDTGTRSPGLLVLQGNQGIGKTTWFNKLSPVDFRLEGATINEQIKDSYINALQYWLVELGEAERAYSKSSLGWLKSFLSNDSDTFRAPYQRTAETHPRRTLFAATVNEENYLRDYTGNRRFLTIQCGESVAYDHRINILQLWAQAVHLAQAGEQYHLTKLESDMLADVNKELLPVSELEELLHSRYDLTAERSRYMQTTEILREVGVSLLPSKASKIIARFLGVAGSRRSNGRKVFDMPE